MSATATVTPQAATFATLVKAWDAEKLLHHYANAHSVNRYGSHDEEMAILKAELLSRVG